MNNIAFKSNEFLTVLVLINLASVDEEVHVNEMLWINKLIKKMGFSEKETAVFESELDAPSYGHLDYFKSITNYYVRSQILNFARHLFTVDGDFNDDEKNEYLKLREIHEKKSSNIIQAEKESAKFLIEMSKSRQMYKDIEKFGMQLSEKKSSMARVSGDFAFAHLFASLLSGPKYSVIFGSLILILFIGFTIYFKR